MIKKICYCSVSILYQHYSTSKEASLVPVHKMVQMIHTDQPRMRLKGPQYYQNTFNTQQFSFNIVNHTYHDVDPVPV